MRHSERRLDSSDTRHVGIVDHKGLKKGVRRKQVPLG